MQIRLRNFAPVIVLLCVSLAVVGCSKLDRTSATDRVNAYLRNNPDTDPGVARAMRSLRLVNGMNEAEVRAAWGEPLQVSRMQDGRVRWWFGCDFPHDCQESSGVRGQHRSASRAVFRDGRVESWGM